MKNSRIDIYETIYNVDLVIANRYASIEELREQYTYPDKEELSMDILDGICTTASVIRISDNKSCILVKYNHDSYVKGVDKNLDFINTISHEAGHVVIRLYQFMDQTICPCSSEPFCYLLGWVTQCIYKTLSGKYE